MTKIIFIHGITGSKNNFLYLHKHFHDSESFDLIGFGDAAKPNDLAYDRDTYLTFLETKIKEKAILVGHSMGSILAKDFAIIHPELVEQLFLISYPIQKNGKALEEIIIKDPFTRALLGEGRVNRIATRFDNLTRFISIPATYLFWHKYYLTVRDYYKHTSISLARTVHNTILKDDYTTLYQVQNKAILIVGARDRNVDQTLLKDFRNFVIPGMKHYFFGYEDQITQIIKENLVV